MAAEAAARYVERTLIVRSEHGDPEALCALLDELPGIRRACMDKLGKSFNVTFDPNIVSDDELLSALRQHGYELIRWRQAGISHVEQQRAWLIEQIQDLTGRAEEELADRGEFAEGMVKGEIGAYARAGRMFGLLDDEEIKRLIPPRFLQHA